MLFFVFLSFDVIPSSLSISRASRLRGTHRGGSIFVDLDDVTSGICATHEALEALRAPRNDRVCVRAALDHVTLFDLLVEERVEAVSASAAWVDLSHDRSFASEVDDRAASDEAAAATLNPRTALGRPVRVRFSFLPGFELLLLESEKESNTLCPKVLPRSA
jgi:hypothetical protein